MNQVRVLFVLTRYRVDRYITSFLFYH